MSMRDVILVSALVDPSAALPATGSLLLTTPRIRANVSTFANVLASSDG